MYNKGCSALSIYQKEVFVTISPNAYGYEWRERCNIIKGICEGLSYLHKNHIVHFDLNRQIYFMEYNMVPKITDFGISRCFDETRPCYYFKSDGISVSRLSLSKALKLFFSGFTFKLCIHYLLISCRGYVLLEVLFNGIITFKSDIYNLSLYINNYGDIDYDEEVF
uniref:Protein kinase domain-containing protein n=1 Tax=Aegilops tauschii subsp. strangulata TaxID=200361 RepID=A0A453PRV3_AEGTS